MPSSSLDAVASSNQQCSGTLADLALRVVGGSYEAMEAGITKLTPALTPADKFVHDYRKQLVRPCLPLAFALRRHPSACLNSWS